VVCDLLKQFNILECNLEKCPVNRRVCLLVSPENEIANEVAENLRFLLKFNHLIDIVMHVEGRHQLPLLHQAERGPVQIAFIAEVGGEVR